MPGRDAGARWPNVPVLLCLAALCRALPAAAQTNPQADLPVVVRGADGVTSRTVQDAVRQASRWLADSGCQQVFSDFRDKRGRTLAENLEATGQTGGGYLRWLVFWDGAHERACIWGDAFATTRPGSRVVHLCPAFKKLQADPGHAAAIVIHEELHSLGLGENPPSSLEITARVLARCGPTAVASEPES
jgi:hypothetical protein